MIIGESRDFRTLAAFGRPDREAPFLFCEGGVDKCLVQIEFPRASNSSTSTRKMRSSLPARTHCWKRRWSVWYGGYI